MQSFLNDQQKKELLKLARDAISLYLKERKVLASTSKDSDLNKIGGVFVTLHKGSNLRGCIGNIVGTKSLYSGVKDMAVASATQDPRFSPLNLDELDEIVIEISVLSPLKEVKTADDIVLGEDGVLVRQGFNSGVYLPQVATETGWSRDKFMDSLCASKAGIDPRAWRTGDCQIFTFKAQVFGE